MRRDLQVSWSVHRGRGGLNGVLECLQTRTVRASNDDAVILTEVKRAYPRDQICRSIRSEMLGCLRCI
jgi:hypothetical protein